MWCSAADTHLKLLDGVVSRACFFTGVVFECDTAHRQSVSVLYRTCYTRSYVTKCALFMVLYLGHMGQCDLLYSQIDILMPLLVLEPRSTQNRRTFIFLSISLWNDLGDPVWRIRWCGPGGFQRRANTFYICPAARSRFVYFCFPFLLFHSMGWCREAGVFGLIRCSSLCPSLALTTFLFPTNFHNTCALKGVASSVIGSSWTICARFYQLLHLAWVLGGTLHSNEGEVAELLNRDLSKV